MKPDSIEGIVDSVGRTGEKIGEAVDRNTESGEERSAELSARHAVDMASDSWLSKNVRPMTLIYLLALQTLLIVLLAVNITVPEVAWVQVGILLGSVVGFYFNSKKMERITEKRVTAAINIERMRNAQRIEDLKLERKEQKIENRIKRKDLKKEKGIGLFRRKRR
jgi:positive regulator of sigma E activity